MAQVKITIKNLPQIRSAFAKSPRVMTKNLRKAIQKALITVQRQSIINAPRRTGFLKASHQHRMLSNLSGYVQPTADYAIFVHEGTRFMRARPFLRQAVAEKEQDIDKLFAGAVQDTLDEIARSAS